MSSATRSDEQDDDTESEDEEFAESDNEGGFTDVSCAFHLWYLKFLRFWQWKVDFSFLSC